uniref:Uncharacterized protein n=1 Tax=Ciona intestinalis TaxID=7719 RepID=H2XWD9_CIOIN
MQAVIFHFWSIFKFSGVHYFATHYQTTFTFLRKIFLQKVKP